jgi:TRAP-type C4-dicarboxylate transport system permease small subunit
MSVDVVSLAFKDKGKIILSMIGNLLFLAFALFVSINGYQVTMKLLTWGQSSPALNIPVGLVYLAGPIGMGLTAIRLLQQLFHQIKRLVDKEAVS